MLSLIYLFQKLLEPKSQPMAKKMAGCVCQTYEASNSPAIYARLEFQVFVARSIVVLCLSLPVNQNRQRLINPSNHSDDTE